MTFRSLPLCNHRALQTAGSESDGCLPWIDLTSEYADFQLAEQVSLSRSLSSLSLSVSLSLVLCCLFLNARVLQLHYTNDADNAITVGSYVYRTIDNCPTGASAGTCTGNTHTHTLSLSLSLFSSSSHWQHCCVCVCYSRSAGRLVPCSIRRNRERRTVRL